jgi:hypothetical protein
VVAHEVRVLAQAGHRPRLAQHPAPGLGRVRGHVAVPRPQLRPTAQPPQANALRGARAPGLSARSLLGTRRRQQIARCALITSGFAREQTGWMGGGGRLDGVAPAVQPVADLGD